MPEPIPPPEPAEQQNNYKPGQAVYIERSQTNPDGTPVTQLAYIVGRRQFTDEDGGIVSGAVVAFIDKGETLPSIKFVVDSDLKHPTVPTLSLPQLSLPFGQDDTPHYRLLGPNNPDGLVLYLEDRLGDPVPYLNQAQLLQVSTHSSQTGEPFTAPHPSQRVSLSRGEEQFSVNYQESLVLQVLAQKAREAIENVDEPTPFSSESADHKPSTEHTFKNGASIVIGGSSWVGTQRPEDEDFFLINPKPEYVDLLLADGMGGHANGRQVAELAVNTFSQALANGEDLQNAIVQANQAVCQFNKNNRVDSGTTLAVARLHQDGQVKIIHAGDSPIFLIQADGRVVQLTKDHSLVQRLVDTNQITAEQARTDPRKNQIYRSLGSKENTVFSDAYQTVNLGPGQALMVACDGLDDMLLSAPSGQPIHTIESFIQHIAREEGKHVSYLTSEDIWKHIQTLKELGYQAPDNITFIWCARPMSNP